MHYQDPVFSHVLKIGVTHKCLHYSLLGGVGDRVRRGFVFFFFFKETHRKLLWNPRCASRDTVCKTVINLPFDFMEEAKNTCPSHERIRIGKIQAPI